MPSFEKFSPSERESLALASMLYDVEKIAFPSTPFRRWMTRFAHCLPKRRDHADHADHEIAYLDGGGNKIWKFPYPTLNRKNERERYLRTRLMLLCLYLSKSGWHSIEDVGRAGLDIVDDVIVVNTMGAVTTAFCFNGRLIGKFAPNWIAFRSLPDADDARWIPISEKTVLPQGKTLFRTKLKKVLVSCYDRPSLISAQDLSTCDAYMSVQCAAGWEEGETQ